ncbi:hypothetical protein BDA99DRAFT_532745 [Phascolomyces articulosus]|uniref:4-hydroxyphenylpyruvate dioxygenase n=1 Tax=Phascolomyces articulosus TaxID=60185 RepID=A0AAD5KN60_9FUNG|nr:hypothetical protein BDA99DRAFT_532745 [Phascolomyces articulosus]
MNPMLAKKSSIQLFVDSHGGAGVRHITLNTNDIITASADFFEPLIRTMMHYGRGWLNIQLEKSNISVDDENGYLMQILTRPVEDRPISFLEITQRINFDGFGADIIPLFIFRCYLPNQYVEMDYLIRALYIDGFTPSY